MLTGGQNGRARAMESIVCVLGGLAGAVGISAKLGHDRVTNTALGENRHASGCASYHLPRCRLVA